jgi:predicted RNase H-like HicB family nuclease
LRFEIEIAQREPCPAMVVPLWSIDPLRPRRYDSGVKRKFHVALLEHDEGVSVSCPALPGCHSQGANVEAALGNIGDAIREYLEVYGEPGTRCEIREMEVGMA